MTTISEGLKHRLRMQRRILRKRLQYAIMRNVFPLSSEEREIQATSVRVLANSIPKAGTNLLSRLMRMMPNTVANWTYHVDETLSGLDRQLQASRTGQVITAHLPWSEELSRVLAALDYRVFLMVRDPRDVAVSGVHYVTQMDIGHPLHRYLAELSDDDARLLAMIEPPDAALSTSIPDVWKNDSFRTFLPWFDDPICKVIRFEDLVGEQGGGSRELQRQTITDVAAHMRVVLSPERVGEIAGSLFSDKSRTFRKGRIGDWPNQFKEHHKEAMKRQAGDVLIKMGYETGTDW